MNYRLLLVFAMSLGMVLSTALAEEESKKALIRDIATVEGVRDNPLVGYGIVVGLKGTGDSRQTIFTVQTLANALQRMGVQIPPGTARVNNVAAVFVTASLPPFARPGMQLDITVSSVGDAKSLEGGLLLLTPLSAADGQVYAAAQGPLTIGGYSAGNSGNVRQVNHPTVGRIAGGGLVERPAPVELRTFPKLALLLREPSFGTASEIASSINKDFGHSVALAADNQRVEIDLASAKATNLADLIAHIEGLGVTVHRRAKVVVNERTGTIVMGKDVRVGGVSILHGNLSIRSQPSMKCRNQRLFRRDERQLSRSRTCAPRKPLPGGLNCAKGRASSNWSTVCKPSGRPHAM